MNEPRGRFTVRAVSNYADASAPAAKRWWELVESPRPTAEQAQAGTEISFAEPAPLSPSSPTGPTDDEIERVAKALEPYVTREIVVDERRRGIAWENFKRDCKAAARDALTAARGGDSHDG